MPHRKRQGYAVPLERIVETLRCDNDLPDSATAVGADIDLTTNTLRIVMEHESFPESHDFTHTYYLSTKMRKRWFS